MNMTMFHRSAGLVFGVSSLFLPLSGLMCQDKAGCADHALVQRFPGARLEYCEEKDHEAYAIATGPVTGYKHIDDWLEVAGRRTRLYYTIEGDVSLRTIYLNYREALERAGGSVLAEGMEEHTTSPEVGSRKFLGVHYGRNQFPSSEGIRLLQGSSTSGGGFYLAGTLAHQGAPVHLVVGGTRYSADMQVVLVDIIAEEGVDTDQIKIDAAWLLTKLGSEGRVDLNDLLFDTDSDRLQDGSMPLLGEVASLLRDRPELKLYVVGHTDMVGELAHNLDLSRRRAAEVVRRLEEDHAIAEGRLDPYGCGPLAPVAGNDSEVGRQRNRRVTLVVAP